MAQHALPDEVKKLLLKLRKGADASFGFKHYKLTLEAIGFRVEVTEKEKRKVCQARFTGPDGASVLINESYRHLDFYELRKWFKERKYNLGDLCSKALGMETLAEERERKRYYERDWTNTGTCGCCERNIKMHPQRPELVHHGYERPGTGEIEGDCFGVGYPPHELSPQCASDYLKEQVRPALASARQWLGELQADKVDVLYISPTSPPVKREHPRWRSYYESALSDAEYRVRRYEEAVVYFEKKVKEWTLDELPEVKLAKRFGPAAQETVP